jgi:hypothetical protein
MHSTIRFTYIDHVNKTVFNRSDIGKKHSAKALLEKLTAPGQGQRVSIANKRQTHHPKKADESVADEIKNPLLILLIWRI